MLYIRSTRAKKRVEWEPSWKLEGLEIGLDLGWESYHSTHCVSSEP